MPVDPGSQLTRVQCLINQALAMPASVATLDADDLDLLLRVARQARLLGRLAADLQHADVLQQLPAEARDQLESALVLARARARLALWELDRIAWATAVDQEMPIVVLKGCAYLLRDLPNAGGRIFADVDLMTSERCLPDLERCLNRHGWITRKLSPYDDNYYRRWTHELPPLVHREREVEIDLHHNILPRTARLRPAGAKLLENAQQLGNSRYLALADEDIALHAITHLMAVSDLADKLRDLVDIRDLLTHFSSRDPDFWRRFLARAVELDLCRPAFYAMRYAAICLGMRLPPEVAAAAGNWAPPAALVWLMDRLVPAALYPNHPDRPETSASFCRWLLYVRSHWIRMPPGLLAYHLGHKWLTRNLRRFSAAPR